MISIEQWRAAIGNSCATLWSIVSRQSVADVEHDGQRWCLVLAILLMIGCVEVNPGPAFFEVVTFISLFTCLMLFHFLSTFWKLFQNICSTLLEDNLILLSIDLQQMGPANLSVIFVLETTFRTIFTLRYIGLNVLKKREDKLGAM